MDSHWEHFDHEADVGVRGVAPSKAGAFAQAALALVGLVTDPAAVRPAKSLEIRCRAPGDEYLLLEWLNRLIFEMNAGDMIFGRFEVSIDDGRLNATVRGEAIDYARHQPQIDPKGATFTALEVRKRDDGAWLAQCVIDV